MKYFAYFIISVVAIAVIAGFFVVGSPQTTRLQRFDEQRIQNLQFMQSEIVNYWRSKEMLPQILTDLEDPVRGIKIPKDPDTAKSYEYQTVDSQTFKLCADFSLPAENGAVSPQVPVYVQPESGAQYGQNWQHDEGRFCFERKIDKDLFPLYKSLD